MISRRFQSFIITNLNFLFEPQPFPEQSGYQLWKQVLVEHDIFLLIFRFNKCLSNPDLFKIQILRYLIGFFNLKLLRADICWIRTINKTCPFSCVKIFHNYSRFKFSKTFSCFTPFLHKKFFHIQSEEKIWMENFFLLHKGSQQITKNTFITKKALSWIWNILTV